MRCARLALLAALGLAGCGDPSPAPIDAASRDAGVPMSGVDAGDVADAGATDAGEAGGDAGTPTDAGSDAGTAASPQVGLLLRDGEPMPCADPTVVSERDERRVYYVYCTSMARIWRTEDWDRFDNVRSSTELRLGAMPTQSQALGSWWAPTVIYAPGAARYVMWVSVPDADAQRVDGRWDTRSLAVLSAPEPTGPWRFERMAIDAARGDQFIDPMLFRNPSGGGHFVYWKQYGSGVPSRIMGSRVDDAWTGLSGAEVEIMNGYGGPGTWEDNVRENPAVYMDDNERFHMLFSGAHWADSSYATGHALSNCGPLCTTAGTGWRMRESGDRGVLHVIQARDLPNRFAHGGPGGAVFQDDLGTFIVYAAAARGPDDAARYLMRDAIAWMNGAPYVDRAGHHPSGY